MLLVAARRPRGRGRAVFEQVGPRRRGDRPRHRRRPASRASHGETVVPSPTCRPRAHRRRRPSTDRPAEPPDRRDGAAAPRSPPRPRRRPTARRHCAALLDRRRTSLASAGSTASTTSIVGANTVAGPGGDAGGGAHRRRTATALALSRSTATAATAGSIRTGRACWPSPRPRATSLRRAREPLGVTDCLNFGNPERPEIMWQFARGASRASATPAARSASRSSAATSASTTRPTAAAIYPTPVIGVVGLLDDASKTRSRAGSKRPATPIVLLGGTRAELGGQRVSGASCTDRWRARPPALDLEPEQRAAARSSSTRSRERLLRSAHDVGEGGLAVALAECSFGGGRRRRRRGGGRERRRLPVATRCSSARASRASLLSRAARVPSRAASSWRAQQASRASVIGRTGGARHARSSTVGRARCGSTWPVRERVAPAPSSGAFRPADGSGARYSRARALRVRVEGCAR